MYLLVYYNDECQVASRQSRHKNYRMIAQTQIVETEVLLIHPNNWWSIQLNEKSVFSPEYNTQYSCNTNKGLSLMRNYV